MNRIMRAIFEKPHMMKLNYLTSIYTIRREPQNPAYFIETNNKFIDPLLQFPNRLLLVCLDGNSDLKINFFISGYGTLYSCQKLAVLQIV